MPKKKIYEKTDYHFWNWWENVYKQELNRLEQWKHPGSIPDPDSYDFKKRELLQAYFYGLCDGRNRVNEGY